MGETVVVSGGGELRELSLPRGQVVRRMALEGAGALCAGGGSLFAASRWGEVIWRLDARLLVPTGLFAGGPGICRLMLSHSGERLYALCGEADSLIMLDARSGAPLLLNRVGVSPCAMALDETGRCIAVAGGGCGEVIVLDAQSLRTERRLSTCGMVFGTALRAGRIYALSLDETMNSAVTAFDAVGVRAVRALPGMPGALAWNGGSLMAATHAGIFMLSPDMLRVRSVFDAAGRAGRLLETGAGLAMIDQWSESLLLRQAGRWRLLGEQVSDAICLTARDT